MNIFSHSTHSLNSLLLINVIYVPVSQTREEAEVQQEQLKSEILGRLRETAEGIEQAKGDLANNLDDVSSKGRETVKYEQLINN